MSQGDDRLYIAFREFNRWREASFGNNYESATCHKELLIKTKIMNLDSKKTSGGLKAPRKYGGGEFLLFTYCFCVPYISTSFMVCCNGAQGIFSGICRVQGDTEFFFQRRFPAYDVLSTL